MASPTNDAVRQQVQRIHELLGDLGRMTHSPGTDAIVGQIETELVSLIENFSGERVDFRDRRQHALDR